MLYWAVFTRGLNRAAPLPVDPTKKVVVRADGKREPVRAMYACWPDADARAFVPAAMDATAVTWRGETIATLGEWDACMRAAWVAGTQEPVERHGVARTMGAWDLAEKAGVDVAAETVWVVCDWWAETGVRVDGASVPAQVSAWRAAGGR